MSRIYEDIKFPRGYGRLSDEDKDKKNFSMESDSISSQRTFIQQFCDERGIKYNDQYYYDDGITGQTFEREGWNQLIKDIESGLVDCVITKDLSRLGRDHSETGYYIERYFPEHNVRYISINDNWDSKYDSVDLILWKLAYNDVYCADISRKVKTILNSKKKQGLYVGSFAPFGYKKCKEDKHVLEIDEEVAYIVKEIFELAYSGLGTTKIAGILNEKKYITPGLYSGRGKNTIIRQQVGDLWTTGMVRRILSNEVYMGDLTQCKIKKVSYKSKKLVKNKRQDWIISQNKHEPLVEREVFHEIQNMLDLTSKKYTRLPGEKHLLSKLIYCKDCNHRISISYKNPKKHENGRCGVCNYYKKYSKYNVCTPHYIDYDELEEQIISYIKRICVNYLDMLDTPALIRDNYKNIKEKIKQIESQKNKIISELDKAENVLINLYEDKLEGKISESVYESLLNKKTSSIDTWKNQIIIFDNELLCLTEQLKKDSTKISDVKTLLNKFIDSNVITQDLIHQIIDKIYVSENDNIQVLFKIEQLKSISV